MKFELTFALIFTLSHVYLTHPRVDVSLTGTVVGLLLSLH